MGECFINNIAGEAIGSIYFKYVGVGTRIQLIIGVCNSILFFNNLNIIVMNKEQIGNTLGVVCGIGIAYHWVQDNPLFAVICVIGIIVVLIKK